MQRVPYPFKQRGILVFDTIELQTRVKAAQCRRGGLQAESAFAAIVAIKLLFQLFRVGFEIIVKRRGGFAVFVEVYKAGAIG